MKKKILFITPSLCQGGLEHSLITMLKLLDKNKYEMYLYTYREDLALLPLVPEYVHFKNDLLNKHYQRNPKAMCLWGVETGLKKIGVKDKAELDGQLSSALKTIMAVSENYPDLKANQNFMQLSEELRNTENKIAFSRQFYNDTVTMYNTKLQVFPSNIIAGMFNFTPSDFFKTDSEEARHNVKVDFGSGNNN